MKNCLFFFLILCLGCTSNTKSTAIHINLINDRSLKITGLDYTLVQEINSDSATANWQGLVPVYRMPADTDLKDYQKPQPGKYSVTYGAVIFTPDTPFTKLQAYFVRYYHYDQGRSLWDDITKHKKLGQQQYTDLIFKQ